MSWNGHLVTLKKWLLHCHQGSKFIDLLNTAAYSCLTNFQLQLDITLCLFSKTDYRLCNILLIATIDAIVCWLQTLNPQDYTLHLVKILWMVMIIVNYRALYIQLPTWGHFCLNLASISNLLDETHHALQATAVGLALGKGNFIKSLHVLFTTRS